MEEDKERLLAHQDQTTQDWSTASFPDDYRIQRERHQERSWTRKALYISLSVNALFTTGLLFVIYYFCSNVKRGSDNNRQSHIMTNSQGLSWTPAQEALEYEWKGQWSIHTEFRGPPRSDYSDLWSNLLSGTLLNVTGEELARAGEIGSVQYQTGGYAAGLGIGHDMHCFKRLKDFLWLRELRPEVERGGQIYTVLQDHADHCLDILRQQMMCQPDISLYNLTYIDHSKLSGNPAPIRQSRQKCVDYRKLQKWMESRAGDKNLFIKPDWIASQPEPDS